MVHTIRIMPESPETEAISAAEQRHSRELDAAVTQLVGSIPRMFRSIKHAMRSAEQLEALRDLGEQQVWLLHQLARGRQLSSELARLFNVTMPTITRSIDALVEKGYVQRHPDPDDRRRIYLQLTEEGEAMSNHAHAQFRSAVARFLSPLSDEQLREVALACSHIGGLLPEHDGDCPARPATEGR